MVGESAGRNMVSAICYSAREHHVQMPVHQVLIYQVTDTKTDTPSCWLDVAKTLVVIQARFLALKSNELTKPGYVIA